MWSLPVPVEFVCSSCIVVCGLCYDHSGVMVDVIYLVRQGENVEVRAVCVQLQESDARGVVKVTITT